MLSRRPSSILRVSVAVGLLVLVAQAALAQRTYSRAWRTLPATEASQVGFARPAWSPVGLWGAWHSPATAPLVPPRVSDGTETTSTAEGETVVNNTNVVIVTPPYYGQYYGQYYGGYPYYRPYCGATYTYFDRGLYNGMLPPFGLSGYRPLKLITIP